jgi:uncharacterized membrane protein YcaP (DUF421 family)
MPDSIRDVFDRLLGLDAEQVNAGQMALRAVLTFVITVAVLRLGDKRLFGKGTTFDTVVAIMIGSVMSRAITDSSPLLATWAAGTVLVGMHWLVAMLAFRFDWFGPFVKGNPVKLIEDGQIDWDSMRESSVTKNDLEQALRAEGNEQDPSGVRRAILERDGTISIIPRDSPPRILDVSVKDGIQTVRIAIE